MKAPAKFPLGHFSTKHSRSSTLESTLLLSSGARFTSDALGARATRARGVRDDCATRSVRGGGGVLRCGQRGEPNAQARSQAALEVGDERACAAYTAGPAGVSVREARAGVRGRWRIGGKASGRNRCMIEHVRSPSVGEAVSMARSRRRGASTQVSSAGKCLRAGRRGCASARWRCAGCARRSVPGRAEPGRAGV
jgi:hypothetical protein